MNWTLLDATDGFQQHAKTFDRLNSRHFKSHPLLCSAFVEPLLKHFSTGDELLCVTSSGHEPDGFLLLTRRQPGIWSVFLPAQAQIAPAVLPPGADLRQLMRILPGPTLGIGLLCQDPQYSFLLPESPSPATDLVEHVTTMNIELTGGFDAYWAARSKNLRRNTSRYLRRLEQDAIGHRLEIISEKSALQEGLIRYGELESSGWKGREGTAIHRDNTQGHFYADVLNRFAEFDRAKIYELYFEDRLVASRITVSSDSMLIILKTTYDEDTSKYASGRLLLHAMLQREFAEQRFSTVEFYTNATRDQISWATGTRPIYHLTQFRNAMLGSLIRGSRPLRAWLDSRKNRGTGT